MKKNTARWWAILTVVLVVYNVVAFALPFPKNGVFFLSWGFTLVAIGAQACVIRTAFGQGEDVKSKFYGFPIAKIGVMYLAAQLVLGLLFMALGAVVPVWAPLVVYAILLGVSAVGFVAADAARDEVVRQDMKLVKDVSRMRAMQAQMGSITSRNTNPEASKALTKLAEEFRFSDPVSSEALAEVEDRLAGLLAQLQGAVEAHEPDKTLSLCQEISGALAQRNGLCKLSKG